MVWALRGAGLRFAESTAALRYINKNILERDKRLARGRLFTLSYELVHNQDILEMEIPDKNRIYVESIKSNIGSPAVEKENLIHLLYDIFIELQEFRESTAFAEDRLDRLKQNIKTLRELADFERHVLAQNSE